MASGKSKNGKKSRKKSTALDGLCELIHECSCIYGIGREVSRCFEPLSREEVSGLKGGDTVWLDVEYRFNPYSQTATVKSYQPITIVSVKRYKQREYGRDVSYETGWGGVGHLQIYDNVRGLDCDLWKLTDQKSLEALVREHDEEITNIGKHIWHRGD